MRTITRLRQASYDKLQSFAAELEKLGTASGYLQSLATLLPFFNKLLGASIIIAEAVEWVNFKGPLRKALDSLQAGGPGFILTEELQGNEVPEEFKRELPIRVFYVTGDHVGVDLKLTGPHRMDFHEVTQLGDRTTDIGDFLTFITGILNQSAARPTAQMPMPPINKPKSPTIH